MEFALRGSLASPATRNRIKYRAYAAAAGVAVTVFALGLAIKQPIALKTGLELIGLLCVAGWLFFNPRVEVTVVLVMLYLGLLDGFIKLKTGSSRVTLARDVLLYSVVLGILVRKVVRKERFDVPPLTGWILAFTAVVAVQLFNPAASSIGHSLASMRPHLEFVPLFFLGYALMRSKTRLRRFLMILLAVTAVNGAVSLIQFNLTPAQLASWGPGYEARIMGTGAVSGRLGFNTALGTVTTRPFALGSDSGFGGVLGMLAVPAAIALIGLAHSRRVQLTAAALSIGVIVAVVTSQGRAAVIGAVVAGLAYFALSTVSRRGSQALIGGIALAIAVLAVGSAIGTRALYRYQSIAPDKVVSTTFQYRKDTIALIPTYAREFPFGAGIGTVGPGASLSVKTKKTLNGENEFTFLLVEVGVPGLLVLLLLHIRILALSLRRVRRVADPELRILLAAVIAAMLALLVTWPINVSTATTPTSPYFWFIGGTLAYWFGSVRGRDATAESPAEA